ncbi:MAG TPA: azurin, partial [Planctomycetaceae bacterium]|nr:azurin [Planctomycetaceae bacterium]
MFRSLFACLGLYLAWSGSLGAEPLKLDRGDSICILGNTLPERMQHDGWLETLIHSRFPTHDLTLRNLAFSGDTLTVRLRSAGFGEPDDFLTKFKADVVFAFFGFGESFAGEAGLAQFRTDLEAFIEHTRGQKYNGESAPQIVLFSPIAYENIGDRNLPDG